MPVRKIPKTYRSLSGESPSRKLGRSAAFESSLERDLLELVEFDPNVVHYEEQPVKIDYLSAELKPRSYTPDILIVYKNETVSPYGKTHVLGEVKYRAELFKNWKKLKPKFKAARRLCRERGWKFSIFTEIEIRTPYLKNVNFLLPYKNHIPNDEYCKPLIGLMNNFRLIEVSRLLEKYSPNETEQLQAIPYIWHLIASERIHTNLNLPLTMNSQIWLPGAKNDEQ